MKALRKTGILAVVAAIAVIGITGCPNPGAPGQTPDKREPPKPATVVSTMPGSPRMDDGFLLILGISIAGTESWTPSSEVFMSGRVLKIKSFYMSDHEVTRAEYKEVIGSDPSMAKAHDEDGHELTGDEVGKNPVNGVSWYDALVYCNKLSIKESLTPCYKING